jgi:hypothetical protein
MPRITAANVPADAHDNRTKPPAATAGIVRISGKVRLSPGVLDNFPMDEFFTKGKLKAFIPNGP